MNISNPKAPMKPSKLISIIVIAVATCCLVAMPLVGCQQERPLPTPDTQEVEPKSIDAEEELDAASEEPAMTEAMRAAQTLTEDLVAPYGSSVGITVLPLDGSKGFDINGDERFVSASMIKLLVLAELMERVDDGSIPLSETHTLRNREIVGGAGVVGAMGSGTVLSIDDLARYMIAESDNTATNILIDRLGTDSITEKASELSLYNTDLQRKMMELGTGIENHMSPNDAARVLAAIANGELAGEQMSDRAIEYLCAQSDNDALAAGLASVRFGHKTGTLDGYRHDAGIVFGDEPYVIAVFTKDVSNADELMARIASAVQERLG